jgi:hypothetical protein
MKKTPSGELSITIRMVYHTRQRGANLLPLSKKPVTIVCGLKLFLHLTDKEAIDNVFKCEIHRYQDLPNIEKAISAYLTSRNF